MSIPKAERLLDLVIALLNSRYYRTAGWIREHVAGYDDAANDEAFARMFERDKQELRDMGIPIVTDAVGDGYRIHPGDFALPPMEFTPAESAALAVASRLWETTVLGDAGLAAMRKLRDAAIPAAGPGDDRTSDYEPPDHAPGVGAGGPALQGRLRTTEPCFADLFAAIRARRAVRFDYRAAPGQDIRTRSLEPWGLVNYRGAWYVTGYDADRAAQRTFRLSRLVGAVTTVGRAGAVSVPDDVDLRGSVMAVAAAGQPQVALLRVRTDAAAGIRRAATVVHAADEPDGFDELQVPMTSVHDLARRVAGQGPHVVVVDPPELRAAVQDLLRGALAAADGDGRRVVTDAHLGGGER